MANYERNHFSLCTHNSLVKSFSSFAYPEMDALQVQLAQNVTINQQRLLRFAAVCAKPTSKTLFLGGKGPDC